MNLRDRVRIERDETKYPPRGTWPEYRGRIGTVVEINPDTKRPDRTEYAIVFKSVIQDGKRIHWGNEASTWFLGHELTPLKTHETRPERVAEAV